MKKKKTGARILAALILGSLSAVTLSHPAFEASGLSQDEFRKIDIGDIDIGDLDPYADMFEFELQSDGTYAVTEWIYENKSDILTGDIGVTIPASYQNIPVTRIERISNDDIVSLTIGNGVKKIDDNAFYLSSKLTNVSIPSSVTEIGAHAFYGTPWLQSMQAKNPLVTVNEILIDASTAKGDVVIPDTVKTVTPFAFKGYEEENTVLTSVVVPQSVTQLGRYAFSECKNLKKVTLPDNLTIIEKGLFNECTNLEQVNIPEGVTQIGEGAFDYCESLKEVHLPSGLTEIPSLAFWCCKSLKNVNIPYGVKTIGNAAFYYCRDLESITIPDSVTAINNQAFAETRSLKSIDFPKSVSKIDGYALYTSAVGKVTIRNPECEIYDSGDTIAWWATIYGYSNSTAQAYAEKYNRNFVALDQTTEKGDVNFDTKVDLSDAYSTLMYSSYAAVGQTPHFTDNSDAALESAAFTAGDIDENGEITLQDAYCILMYSSYQSLGQPKTWEEIIGG